MAKFTDEERAQIHAELDMVLGDRCSKPRGEHDYRLLDRRCEQIEVQPGKWVRGLCLWGGCTETRVNKTHCELHRDLAAAKARAKAGRSLLDRQRKPVAD